MKDEEGGRGQEKAEEGERRRRGAISGYESAGLSGEMWAAPICFLGAKGGRHLEHERREPPLL